MISVNKSLNLVDHFVDRHMREGRGPNRAIVCGDRNLTYSEVTHDVNRVGNGLLRLGVGKKTRVMLVLPDGADFVSGYFGAMKIGAVAVPTATGLTNAAYARLIAESHARVVILHSQFFGEIAPLLGCLPHLRHLVVVGEERAGCIGWESWLAGNSGKLAPAPVSEEYPAFLRWTCDKASGGSALHRHGDWICCCRNYASDGLEMTPDDVVFSPGRLFQARGLGSALMSPFNVGASTILSPGNERPAALLAEMERKKPTVVFFTPTQYKAMLRENEKKYDLSGIRLAVSVAEPLPEETLLRWEHKFGVRIVDAMQVFATRRRPQWEHWRSGARALYGQQILGRQ